MGPLIPQDKPDVNRIVWQRGTRHKAYVTATCRHYETPRPGSHSGVIPATPLTS